MSLDADTRTRLVKLCGMFSSEHDGERANAAKMADALIRSKGLTWGDVIGNTGMMTLHFVSDIYPGERRPGYDPFAKHNDRPHWDDKYWNIIREAQENTERLTPWERSFIQTISCRLPGMPFSIKQKDALDKIGAKLHK